MTTSPGQSLEDVSSGIVRCAQNDDPLFILIGGRIVEAEDPTLRELDLPAIAFRYLPGRTKAGLRGVWSYTVQFLIYSDTSYREAQQIWAALANAFSYAVVQENGTNFKLYPNQAPSSNFIEEDGEFILSTFWTVQAIDP